MDESRKRAASNADAKIISSSLDKDFGNDFLSSWKVPKSGKDAIDFDVESVPKSSKKFSFDNLDDFGLDGAFDKMASFKMGMSDLDFSSPVKKKSKHSSSNGNDLSEGKKETEKDSFFSFDDFNDLGKFNLDTKLGFERNGTRKITEKNNPISSEGNKDPQRGISDKGTDVPKDSKSKEQTQTQTHDACTLKPTHLTSINPERVEQLKVDMASNDMPGEHSNEADPTKPAVNNSSHSPCSTVSAEVPTHSKVIAVPENSKEAPAVDLSKLNISRENSNNEQEVSSQSRNTSTKNPYISRRSVRQSDFQNNQKEAVEESTSLNEGSHGSQSFGGTLMKPLRKTSSGTKNVEEGTSGPKNLSSSTQREIRNVKPALVNETATFSLLSKSANRKASRPPQVTSETTLNEQSGANNVIKKTNTYPTDLKREHKHAQPEKLKITSAKPYCKPGLQGLSTTSLSAKHGLEPLTAGNLSILNAPGSTSHSSEHNNATSQVLLKSSKPSEIIQGAPSKDGKRATSQLAGSRVLKVGARSGSPVSGLLLEKDSVQVSGRKGSPVLTSKIPNSLVEGRPASRSPSIRQNMPEESIPDTKAPSALKRIMRSPAVRKSPQTVPEPGNKIIPSGTPKARTDNVVSSTTPCEMGDISDLELPAMLEDDGNVDKAEACRKELEDMCILLKRKHTEAKELAVRSIVNNNMLLMLNHPMFEEKMSALQKFANSLRSKKRLFEEITAMDTH